MSFKTRRIREEKPRRSLLFAKKVASSSRRFAVSTWRWLKAKRKGAGDEKNGKGKGTKGKDAPQQKPSAIRSVAKRVAIVCMSALVILILLLGVARALIALKVVSLKSFLNVTATDLVKDQNGYTNFLLLGRGDDDHDGVDLTDTMMVASFDPSKTKSVVFLSVPRDLYVMDVNADGMGKSRINELYRNYKDHLIRKDKLSKAEASQKSLKALMDDLGQHLGIPIHYAVIVNFSGFVKAVDAIGGIDVDVPYDIVDTQYPGPNWTYETYSIKAGPAHLDGEAALKYVRSRHTTSDFGRSARQQQVLKAVADKASTLGIMGNPGKLLSLYDILSKNVESSMNMGEILGAAKIAQEIDKANIISMQLNDGNGLYGNLPAPGGFLYPPPRDQFAGAAVLLPVSVPPTPVTWKQISSFTRLIIDHRDVYLSHPTLAILNAGGKQGLANTLGAELIRYGFDVKRIENAHVSAKTAKQEDFTMILAGTGSTAAANTAFMSTLLHIPTPPSSVAPIPREQQEQVTIVLGKGYTYSPIQNLLPAAP